MKTQNSNIKPTASDVKHNLKTYNNSDSEDLTDRELTTTRVRRNSWSNSNNLSPFLDSQLVGFLFSSI